jgi:ABC-type bacteriocin/lantibiotic exporter with double-glycine peptidase domain
MKTSPSAFAGSFLRSSSNAASSGTWPLAAFVLYGLGLMTPMFFQLVIDKVLVHQSYATLTVLTIGIAIALVFDATFTFLRRYLLLYATNRIDIRIATRNFRASAGPADLPV